MSINLHKEIIPYLQATICMCFFVYYLDILSLITLDILYDFLKISDHFANISKDSPKIV